MSDTTRHDGQAVTDRTRAVDVLEAALRLNITPDAVRAKLRRRTLEGFRDNQGRWRVVLPDTIGDTTTSSRDTTERPTDTTATVDRSAVAALEATVGELRARVDSLEDERDRLLTILADRERGAGPRFRDTLRRLFAAWADKNIRANSVREE